MSKDNQLSLVNLKNSTNPNIDGLDEYLQSVCLERTVGEMMWIREHAGNAKAFFGANLIFDAIFGRDINIIKSLIMRIDGATPSKTERKRFANLFGEALEDVFNCESIDQMHVSPNDLCITALAKAAIIISMLPAGNNVNRQKQKVTAYDLVLTRIGGRRTEPVKQLEATKFVDPDWMTSLPSGK